MPSYSIKIFKQSELFEKFGLNANIENKEVVETLKKEGYSVALINGDELVVFDNSLIHEVKITC